MMATLFEYNNTGDANGVLFYGANWLGQSFTPALAHSITSVNLKLARSGNPGTITVSIRATDGSGLPTGSDLTSGATNGDTLTTDLTVGEWRDISLTSYSLIAGTKYAIVVRNGGDVSNFNTWRNIASDQYSGGSRLSSSNSGSTWSATTSQDFMFEDWGVTSAFIPKVFIF